jgi:hypothetical protein
MNSLIIAEEFHIDLKLKILKPINLKEKQYKKNPAIFPQLQIG